MLRKHAALIFALSLIALVAAACIVRTTRPPPRGRAVYVEKHKPAKHRKHKHKHKHKHKKHKH